MKRIYRFFQSQGSHRSAALAEKFKLHPNQISQWKVEFIEKSQLVFSGTKGKEKEAVNVEVLYARIGQLEIWRWNLTFYKKPEEERTLT